MENKDVYSTAGNEEGVETKNAPGYVPAPLIRSDYPTATRGEDGDATVTADDEQPGTPAYANRGVDTVGRSDSTTDPETGKAGREDSSKEPLNEATDAESKKTSRTGGTKK